MALWLCGAVAWCVCGSVALGLVRLWRGGSVVLAPRLCGFLSLWFCGAVALALWLLGLVAPVRLRGDINYLK